MAAVSDALLVLFGEIAERLGLVLINWRITFLPVNSRDDDPGAEVRLGDVVGSVLSDEPGEGKV